MSQIPPLPLPIPPEDWLRRANQRYRSQEIPPESRPWKAFSEWATENNYPLKNGIIDFFGSSVGQAIDNYFQAHTHLGQQRERVLARTAFFYDGSFFPVNLPIIPGHETTGVNALEFLVEMPNSLQHDFAKDEAAVRQYLDHISDVLDSVHGYHLAMYLQQPFARELLQSAEHHLDSAVANLLDLRPNSVIGEVSRLAFECSLKGFLAEKGGLIRDEAENKIRHRLDKLFAQVSLRCPPIDSGDLKRLEAVVADSIRPRESRRIFPDFGERYEGASLPNERLWKCYSAGSHAFATVSRILIKLDRELN